MSAAAPARAPVAAAEGRLSRRAGVRAGAAARLLSVGSREGAASEVKEGERGCQRRPRPEECEHAPALERAAVQPQGGHCARESDWSASGGRCSPERSRARRPGHAPRRAGTSRCCEKRQAGAGREPTTIVGTARQPARSRLHSPPPPLRLRTARREVIKRRRLRPRTARLARSWPSLCSKEASARLTVAGAAACSKRSSTWFAAGVESAGGRRHDISTAAAARSRSSTAARQTESTSRRAPALRTSISGASQPKKGVPWRPMSTMRPTRSGEDSTDAEASSSCEASSFCEVNSSCEASSSSAYKTAAHICLYISLKRIGATVLRAPVHGMEGEPR